MSHEIDSPFDLAQPLIAVAQRAGFEIMEVFAQNLNLRYKPDRSPVTDADVRAEAVILDALAALAPGVPVVAEETMAAGKMPKISDAFFLVDPLDGTRGFVKGSAEFTVNIALMVANRPLFGLIYAPALHECYVTLSQSKAILLELAPTSTSQSIDLQEGKPLSGQSERARSELVAVMSNSHVTSKDTFFLQSLRPSASIAMSSSLKFCVVAKGMADVYPRFGPTSEWDVAAGHAILKAAGGDVVTPEGAEFRYGKHEANFINPPFIAWRRLDLRPTGAALPFGFQ